MKNESEYDLFSILYFRFQMDQSFPTQLILMVDFSQALKMHLAKMLRIQLPIFTPSWINWQITELVKISILDFVILSWLE